MVIKSWQTLSSAYSLLVIWKSVNQQASSLFSSCLMLLCDPAAVVEGCVETGDYGQWNHLRP
jgi:hypothetical protein